MANQATTTYKVTGSRKAVSDLWKTFQVMNVNTKNVWLNELADFYGIDYGAKQISVRGHIYWADYEEDDENTLLSFETESAWDACTEHFAEINQQQHHQHEWVSKTGIEQGERTEEQMVDFINEYEYENEETYFYIRVFTFE